VIIPWSACTPVKIGPVSGVVPFRLLPFRLLPFRLLPFRLEPFRLMPFKLVPFRLLPFRLEPFRLVPFKLVPFKLVPFKLVPFKLVPFKLVPAMTVVETRANDANTRVAMSRFKRHLVVLMNMARRMPRHADRPMDFRTALRLVRARLKSAANKFFAARGYSLALK